MKPILTLSATVIALVAVISTALITYTSPSTEAATNANFLVLDEDMIDNVGEGSVYDICGSPLGTGQEDDCVNDDIAGLNQRMQLFTGPSSNLPQGPIVWPPGGHSQADYDPAIWKFTFADPQESLQNGTMFTIDELIAPSDPADDENNLDKVKGVVPVTDYAELVGNTYCALVYDSDVSSTGT